MHTTSKSVILFGVSYLKMRLPRTLIICLLAAVETSRGQGGIDCNQEMTKPQLTKSEIQHMIGIENEEAWKQIKQEIRDAAN